MPEPSVHDSRSAAPVMAASTLGRSPAASTLSAPAAAAGATSLSSPSQGVPLDAEDAALLRFVTEHPQLFVLSGAGVSTASGLGDYRDRNGQWKRRQPITGQLFIGNEAARKRYWARSAVGWPAFSRAAPGVAHHALAGLQATGTVRHLVTQNVDRLHQKAGHRSVIDLHGVLATVSCIRCHWQLARDDFQSRLLGDNPWLSTLSAEYAPDGDADLEHTGIDDMHLPACERCAGILKPDVVFFGENVPRSRVELAMRQLRGCDAMLVAGSSLMVFSGYRFCREAAALRQPIVIINDGRTRADDLATLKVGGDCGIRLQRLAAATGVPPVTTAVDVGGNAVTASGELP